jgi:hypothetical protein
VAVIANSRPYRIALVRVARRHAEAGAGEGSAQRRPGGPQLVGGGIDAAELFGELESTIGLGPVGEEPAGLPAHCLLACKAPLVGVGESSTSIRRWIDGLYNSLFHKAVPDAPLLHWSWQALMDGQRHSDTLVGCIVWSITASTTARTPTTARDARP